VLIENLKLGRPLKGQVALITGAGQGIGREAALALSALGASIVVVELRDTGRESAGLIAARGGDARFFQVDVSDPVAMHGLKDEVGPVDIVINDAVVFYVGRLVDTTVEQWDRVMAVNLRGAFLAAKLFLPGMIARRRGVFVTMQSGDGMPYMASYFASKVALRSLASSLSQEVGRDSGVSVFCFGAGMVATPAIREAVPKLAPLYGVTEHDFVSQSAPGGVLMSAEECALGLAGCVIHAPELNGQEPAAVTGLALLGIGDGEWGGTHDVPAAGGTLETLVDDMKREFDDLGMFQRAWYRRTLKQRSGRSLEEWETVARSIREAPAVSARYAPDLRRLAGYFVALEQDARGYIRDRRRLDEAIGALEARRAVAQETANSLR
jgi:NAD(P)-dependent dehydrogenase (short-subunit alcohol dehydrogenase family)